MLIESGACRQDVWVPGKPPSEEVADLLLRYGITAREPAGHARPVARWAATNMTPPERAEATVYTSGEHCPMCAAAHGWAGLGRIVYATSSEQMTGWLAELGVAPTPVLPRPIAEIVPGVPVAGPAPQFAEQVRDLHREFHSARQ